MIRFKYAVSVAIIAAELACPVRAQNQLLGPVGPTSIAQADLRTPQERYNAAFQEMLRSPGDMDILFRYAALATAVGDYEGAISALERMLVLNPNLPQVRLELGVLYYRIGSYLVARSYLDGVRKTEGAPPEVRGRAEQFLAETNRQLTESKFIVEAFFGWRYQSNANSGPPTSTVRLYGQTTNITSDQASQPDWGVVGTVRLQHLYDLGRQDRSALETTLAAYSDRHFSVGRTNVSLVDFNTGPRMQIFSDQFKDLTIRPFGTAGHIWVNDTPYSGGFGAGADFGVLLTDTWRNDTTALWRRRIHPDTWYLSTNGLLTGSEVSGTTTFQHNLTPMVTLFAVGSGQRYQSDTAPWQSYWALGAGGGMTFRFSDPLFDTRLLWFITLSYNYQWWNYDAADPQIDPSYVRQQRDSSVNLVIGVPFDDRTTLTISGGRYERMSDLANYAFENTSAMMGFTRRF